MQTIEAGLSVLPAYKQEELRKIVPIIRERMKETGPEMVILFGSYARGEGVEDRYREGHIIYEYCSDFDLLVIVRFKSIQRHSKLERTLRQMIQESGVKTPVSIIVHDIEFVNQALTDSQYFFVDIINEGVMLYDSKQFELGQPVTLPPAKRFEFAQEDFEKWFKKASTFLKVAHFCMDENEYSHAAFELHQCAESLFSAVMLVYTHYRPKCHDLEKLRELICTLDEGFIESFLLHSDEDKRLFELLCEAYIDSRYKRDYAINVDDLTAIAKRVKVFQDTVKRRCLAKIQDFEAEAAKAVE